MSLGLLIDLYGKFLVGGGVNEQPKMSEQHHHTLHSPDKCHLQWVLVGKNHEIRGESIQSLELSTLQLHMLFTFFNTQQIPTLLQGLPISLALSLSLLLPIHQTEYRREEYKKWVHWKKSLYIFLNQFNFHQKNLHQISLNVSNQFLERN